MELKRAIISISLLFIYALGFSHSLIPHCHDGERAKHTVEHTHHHEHHHHSDLHSVEHEHVLHKGHYDDGILDLIICALSETEHSETDASQCFFIPETTNYKSKDPLCKLNCLALKHSLYLEYHGALKTAEHYFASAIPYPQPAFYISSQRGPPIVS